jgi:hypothetical protein
MHRTREEVTNLLQKSEELRRKAAEIQARLHRLIRSAERFLYNCAAPQVLA